MENTQFNIGPAGHPPGSEPQGEKSQAGTNLAIVVLVLVIVVVGVKLLMSGTPTLAPGTAEVATSTETKGEMSHEESASMVESVMSEGKGDVMFVVSSSSGVIVREISVYNPFKDSWVLVYDGYKSVGAGQAVEIFKASLAPLTYDRVKVRTLSADTGASNEVVKEMPVTVIEKKTASVTIEL